MVAVEGALRPRLTVAWKTATWLGFNLGAQAIPILYLWWHSKDDDATFREYVNCTLAMLVAFGMLFAAISDVITERARPGAWGSFGLLVIVVMALAALHRAAHDEFVRKESPDFELFCGSLIVAFFVIAVGTSLKMKMWYNQAVGETEG